MADSFEKRAVEHQGQRTPGQELRRDIAAALNRNSVDARLNVPDFILAEYVVDCLRAYATLMVNRGEWAHGDPPEYVETFPL